MNDARTPPRTPFIVGANERPEPRPGQLLARGVCRHLLSYDFVTVEELSPSKGLRVDVMALGPKSEVWIVECKSSRADFQSDQKWSGYLEWCDRYFWAVDADFPSELLPSDTGLIIADAYDAEIVRMGPETKLPAARRKVMVHKFARHAALRHHAARDPELVQVWG
ncbi:MAG: MmcB family DNA repair protein [Pseudomonadota bacterium]